MVLPQTNCNSFDLFCFMYYGVPSTTKKVPEILSGIFQIIRGQRSRSANQRREYKSGPIKDVHIVFSVNLWVIDPKESENNIFYLRRHPDIWRRPHWLAGSSVPRGEPGHRRTIRLYGLWMAAIDWWSHHHNIFPGLASSSRTTSGEKKKRKGRGQDGMLPSTEKNKMSE